MLVEHMVWFRFRDEVTAEERARLKAELMKLAEVVPGILRLLVGENFTERALGCQLGLVVTLESRAALASYQEHEAHVAVALQLRRATDQILALDFEHPSPEPSPDART